MTESTGIILLAHGSRDEHWLQPFFDLHAEVAQQHGQVALAFMELAQPDIESAVQTLLDKNVQRIEVLPLFFAAGRHLRRDVPAMLEQISQNHQVTITLKDPVGAHPLMLNALTTIIREAVE